MRDHTKAPTQEEIDEFQVRQRRSFIVQKRVNGRFCDNGRLGELIFQPFDGPSLTKEENAELNRLAKVRDRIQTDEEARYDDELLEQERVSRMPAGAFSTAYAIVQLRLDKHLDCADGGDDTVTILRGILAELLHCAEGSEAINIIFDGPPSHESGRFVEVEDDDGKSVCVGDWIERDDGLWALRIQVGDAKEPAS